MTAAGRTVLDEDTGRRCTRLADLEHDGRPLTTDGHACRPGSAVYVDTTGWQGPQVVEVCTDPAGIGHRDRWTANALPAGAAGEEPSEDEREAASAERRATIENNKAMAAANETRREWIKGLLQCKTAPKAALRFAVETMAADPRRCPGGCAGNPTAPRTPPPPTAASTPPASRGPPGTSPLRR